MRINAPLYHEFTDSGELFSNEILDKICLHEIGHAIGLWRHSFNKNSIMYAKTTIDGIKQTILKEDIERLKKSINFNNL